VYYIVGLRHLEDVVEEARKMPIDIDILENRVLGREYKRGELKGKLEGELTILHRLITKRFGPIPGWRKSDWPADRQPSSKT
jgi:hypothetical protein